MKTLKNLRFIKMLIKTDSSIPAFLIDLAMFFIGLDAIEEFLLESDPELTSLFHNTQLCNGNSAPSFNFKNKYTFNLTCSQ